MSGLFNSNDYYKSVNNFQDVNEVFRCKSCGAPREPFSSQCKYCKSFSSNSVTPNVTINPSGIQFRIEPDFYKKVYIDSL